MSGGLWSKIVKRIEQAHSKDTCEIYCETRSTFGLNVGRFGFLSILHTRLYSLPGDSLYGWLVVGDLSYGLWFGSSLFLWGAIVRTVFVLNGTWAVNSVAHLWGYRNYDTSDNSRNNWLVALLTHGGRLAQQSSCGPEECSARAPLVGSRHVVVGYHRPRGHWPGEKRSASEALRPSWCNMVMSTTNTLAHYGSVSSPFPVATLPAAVPPVRPWML